MKLHCIYLFIGISTLTLNALLTIKLLKGHSKKTSRENCEDNGEIIFSLARDRSTEDATTAAVQYDDTVFL